MEYTNHGIYDHLYAFYFEELSYEVTIYGHLYPFILFSAICERKVYIIVDETVEREK